MPKEKSKNLNIPNALSVLRILLIIPFMICYLRDYMTAAVVVLILSGISDALDGFVARHFNQRTQLGQMLDPISDKLTQAAVAVSLAIRHTVLLPFLLVFIFKEGIMLAAGGILLRRRKRPCAARWYGKVDTVLFYITFVSILLMDLLSVYYDVPVLVLLTVTCVMMVFALVMYAREFFRILKSTAPEDQLDLDEVMDKHRT